MDPLYVIKIGGNIIDDESNLLAFLKSFSELKGNKILVHGGGKLATQFAQKLGIEPKILDGRRITDKETLKIVTMVYAGYINKNIVAKLQSLSCNAVGLCGTDADAILAHKRKHPFIDFGYVGDIDLVHTDLIKSVIKKNITIVFAPITHDGKGQLLNTNADTIAQEIAKAMSQEYSVELIYTFEKAGVLLDAEDDQSVIPTINPAYFEELKQKGNIFAGMIPKLDNAFLALDKGVKKVIIGQAGQLKKLVDGKAGTTITDD